MEMNLNSITIYIRVNSFSIYMRKLNQYLFAGVLGATMFLSPVQGANVQVNQCQKVINDYTGIFLRASDQTGTRVGVLRTGDIVKVLEQKKGSNWTKISYPKKGYVESKYLQPIDCKAVSKPKIKSN
jgi:hypothetical protein